MKGLYPMTLQTIWRARCLFWRTERVKLY